MSAHVLYPALDPDAPATLSKAIATDLLRTTLGFRGVLVSDDLEMKALSQEVETTAVSAIAAGCDMALVCSSEPMVRRARAALASAIAKDPTFRARCEQALERGLAMRRTCRPASVTREERDAVLAGHAAIAAELADLAGRTGS
jgi:beta-N-acetylhexosaminidase